MNPEESTPITVTEAELLLINRYTRRPMTAEEVYTFTVVLCDNEVDRDHECFTAAALQELAGLFLGKTGIFDHSAKAENQAARIFDTYLEEDTESITTDGEPYTRLMAKAYLPRSEKTEALMLEIDSGIKKEVSVGCALRKRICSICGADKHNGSCAHQKGRTYSVAGATREAHDILSEPMDAYEWSFVAVPAQRNAGVVKHYLPMEDGAFSLEKLLEDEAEEWVLSKQAALALHQKLEALRQQAEAGQRYRDTLLREVKQLCRLVQPELAAEVSDRMLKQASLADLEQLKQGYQKQAEKQFPLRPQLWSPETAKQDTAKTEAFKI